MQTELQLSIILPTYNRLYALRNIFLPSLAYQTFLSYELYIVDDCSDDGTLEYFTKGGFFKEYPQMSKRVQYYKNDTNIGAPASRNIGVKYAKGKWSWIVEDDIQIPDSDFLARFIEISKYLSEEVGVISPKRIESISQGYYSNPPRSFVRIGKISGEIYLDPEQEYTGEVPNTHCSSFIKTDLYNAIGGQDDQLYYGNTFRDESDLYLRVVAIGKKIMYVGDQLKIVHRNDFAQSGGQKKINETPLLHQEFMVMRNHYRYLRKNYNFPGVRVIFFIVIRSIKHISTLLHVHMLKKILSLLQV